LRQGADIAGNARRHTSILRNSINLHVVRVMGNLTTPSLGGDIAISDGVADPPSTFVDMADLFA